MFLSPLQKSACESVWRAMTERDETPLGLSRRMIDGDDKDARYLVATSVLMLPAGWLPRVIKTETERFGPLRDAHRFEWEKRDMRSPGSRAALRPASPAAPRLPPSLGEP